MSVLQNLTSRNATVSPTEIKESKALFEAKRKERASTLTHEDIVIKKGAKTTSVESLLKGRIQYSKEMIKHDSILSKMIEEKVSNLNSGKQEIQVSKIVAQLAESKRKQKETDLTL